jgi:hypothetical protein
MKSWFLLLSIITVISGNCLGLTPEEFAGTYVGKRTYILSDNEHQIFNEISIYNSDGSYVTRLEDKFGLVYYDEGSITFDANGGWTSNSGPKFHADFRGNALVVFVDWRTMGGLGVVHSVTHWIGPVPELEVEEGN